MLDCRQHSLLHLCALVKIFIIKLMLRIFGRVGFIDMSQQPCRRPYICFFQILEFCFKFSYIFLTFLLPDCLVICHGFTLIALQGLCARQGCITIIHCNWSLLLCCSCWIESFRELWRRQQRGSVGMTWQVRCGSVWDVDVGHTLRYVYASFWGDRTSLWIVCV